MILCSKSAYPKKKLIVYQRLSLFVKNTDHCPLDDFCLTEYTAEELEALYDILNDRYGKKTVIVTSQKSPDIWLENLGKTTLAEAVVERFSTNNHTLLLKGKSLRRMLDPNGEFQSSAY